MTASGKCLKGCSLNWPKVSSTSQYMHDFHHDWHTIDSFLGIPELGIEHFEPLILQSVQVSRGSGSLTLAGGFKNLIVKGPSNTTVSRARWALIWNFTRVSAILKGLIFVLTLQFGSGEKIAKLWLGDSKTSHRCHIQLERKHIAVADRWQWKCCNDNEGR